MGKSKSQHTSSSSRMLDCEYCELKFHDSTQLKKHIHRSHKNTERHYCPECPEVKDNLHDFMHHMRTEHKVGHLCRICKQAFPRQKMRTVHEKQVHDYVHGLKPKVDEVAAQQAALSALPSSSQIHPLQVPMVVPPQMNAMMPIPQQVMPIPQAAMPIPQSAMPIIPPQLPMFNPYLQPMTANLGAVQMPMNSIVPTPTLVEPPRVAAYPTQQTAQYNTFVDPTKNPYAPVQQPIMPSVRQPTSVITDHSQYYAQRQAPEPAYATATKPAAHQPPRLSPPSFAPPLEASQKHSYSEREHYERLKKSEREDYERLKREEYEKQRRHEKEDYERLKRDEYEKQKRHEKEGNGRDQGLDFSQQQKLLDYAEQQLSRNTYERSHTDHQSKSYESARHRVALENEAKSYSYGQPSKSSYHQSSSSRYNPY